MNKIILDGRLCNDPEVKYTEKDNRCVTYFTIASDRKYKQEGNPQADFIKIIAFDKIAEFISKYFKKGSPINIVGRLQVRSYDDKDGKKVYVTEVVVEEASFVLMQKTEAKEEFKEDTGSTLDELPF